MLLLIGAAVGGYFYGHNKTTTVTKTIVTTPKATTESSAHFVQSVGYPFDLGAKTQITTKLGVPASMQAVREIPSMSQGLATLLTDKDNDSMARYSLGNPEDSNDNGGGASEISIVAISKSWLAANGKTDNSLDNYIDNTPIQTVAQKQKFVSDLKTATTACAADASKGFATKDKVFNICYSVDPGREAYSPVLVLKGYAEVEKQPLVFGGTVNLYDPTTYTDQTAEQKVITDAKAGKLPAKTKAAVDALTAALAQTTVTASPNPLKQ